MGEHRTQIPLKGWGQLAIGPLDKTVYAKLSPPPKSRSNRLDMYLLLFHIIPHFFNFVNTRTSNGRCRKGPYQTVLVFFNKKMIGYRAD